LCVMDAFEVRERLSPLAIAKLQKGKRQRARSKSGKKDEGSDITDW